MSTSPIISFIQGPYNNKRTKTHNDSDQANKYSINNNIKMTNYFHVFATKNMESQGQSWPNG